MLGRVVIPILLAVSIIAFVPLTVSAKGRSPIEYFTIEGPGILWPARFTAGPHLPYDHEVRVASHPLDSRHFVVRGYVQDDMEHQFSPFYLWLTLDGKADIYVAGEDASGFNYRWFSGRPEFVAPVRRAILFGYALTSSAFLGPVVAGAIVLKARKRVTRRAKVMIGTDSPVQA